MSYIDSIGGYFSLELCRQKEFHPKLIALNTGRNALEYVLRANQFAMVYLPCYLCDALLEPFKKTNTQYCFYKIDELLQPESHINIKKNSALLYINYFGVKGNVVTELSERFSSLIIDNSQAFFESPMEGIDTFYSCRKFFGVSDGSYLSSKKTLNDDFPVDLSGERVAHLLIRMERGAEAGYQSFVQNESSLVGRPIKEMSKLTHALLQSINYDNIISKRNENFLFLHQQFGKLNELFIDVDSIHGPMSYPLLVKNEKLRNKLIERKIYIPTYWQNVFGWSKPHDWEYYLASYLLSLPIDQRYSITDMESMTTMIMECMYG